MSSTTLKGIQKSKLSTYQEAVQQGTADGYLWLVRDFDENNIVKSSAIYFGDRLYAEKNISTISGNDTEMDDGEDEPSTPEEQEETAKELNEVAENGGTLDLETDVTTQTTIQ